MGCDIHAWLEIKCRDPNKWIEAPIEIPSHRNYEWFAALAGVRGGGNGPDPKGLPDDLSSSVKRQVNCEIFHSHSHSYTTVENYFDLCIFHTFKEEDGTWDPNLIKQRMFQNHLGYDRDLLEFYKQVQSKYEIVKNTHNEFDGKRIIFCFDS